jgi:hypothetical protein
MTASSIRRTADDIELCLRSARNKATIALAIHPHNWRLKTALANIIGAIDDIESDEINGGLRSIADCAADSEEPALNVAADWNDARRKELA